MLLKHSQQSIRSLTTERSKGRVFLNQTDSCWSTNRSEAEKNVGVVHGSQECALFWCHGESIRAGVGTGTRRTLRRLHPRSPHRIQPGIGLSFLPTLAQRSSVRQ